MFSPYCLFVGWSVGLYAGIDTKNTEQIPIKLGWRMGLSPEQTSSMFGEDSGILFHFL